MKYTLSAVNWLNMNDTIQLIAYTRQYYHVLKSGIQNVTIHTNRMWNNVLLYSISQLIKTFAKLNKAQQQPTVMKNVSK